VAAPSGAAASADRIVLPDRPASMRGRHHLTAGSPAPCRPAPAPGTTRQRGGRPGEGHAGSRTSDTYSARPAGHRSRNVQIEPYGSLLVADCVT